MESKKRVIFTILFFLVATGVIFLPGFSKLHKLREENEQLEQRIKLLERNNDDLKEELAMMRQDPEYVEQKARERLGIIKKGEVVYRRGDYTTSGTTE